MPQLTCALAAGVSGSGHEPDGGRPILTPQQQSSGKTRAAPPAYDEVDLAT